MIDAEAKARLEAHIARMKHDAQRALRRRRAGGRRGPTWRRMCSSSTAPADLADEVFGPVLHVVRYKAGSSSTQVLRGHRRHGLRPDARRPFAHRLDGRARSSTRLSVGNVYVNRNMIGAVVGVQPFGGHGLSGTGPKAGGPHYLLRFATEQTVTINTAAAGGNANLIAMGEG